MSIAALPATAFIVLAAISAPVAIVLGVVPFFVVIPVLLWMDRLEPEPWSARLHALLWGAFVAGSVSLVVNTIVSLAIGDIAAAVLSAPIIEEVTKAGAILWAVRRREVDGVMDGLVYAGWTALGFAVIEDFSYFAAAAEDDLLVETFVARALLTPFAHPLFTAWTGVAIGLAVRHRQPLKTAWWGLVLAIGAHALWNGSLALSEVGDGGAIVALAATFLFVLLFLVTFVGVIKLRQRDANRLTELFPFIAQRYSIPPDRLFVATNLRARRRSRNALEPHRRKQFDQEIAAIARLAALFDHASAPDSEDEARLVTQLDRARNRGG
ncbi:MAG: PrsW family intramembrane metalloprotease [Acidimicrobiales bacterium]